MAQFLACGAGDATWLDLADFLKDDRLFLADGAVGVEELVGDVSEDGGAARGDTAFGDEDEEAGEELVDGSGGVEFGRLREEIGGEIFEVVGRECKGEAGVDSAAEMAEAEASLRR